MLDTEAATLASGSISEEDTVRKRLSSLFDGMMRAAYNNAGAQLSIEILADPQVREFIDAHAGVLDSSFERTSMSNAMRRRLQRSDFIFSGMKTFHELNEAFPSMLDENGERKPFERFLNDVRSIDETYNTNYLRAEYNFVSASAEMAAKWEEFEQDGDRYNLQYRTQKDDKVRPEHAALDGVTLPPSDSFWTEFYPPNGWNCRCNVVQVRKSKYPATDHDEAMILGDVALQKDAKGMFHFNAGIEQSTVPDYNPYTISKCRNCNIAKDKGTLARELPPDNQVCAACHCIRGMANQIEINRQLYEKLRNDPNYHSVEFDPKTGGVKAIHKGHIIHSSEKEKTFFGNENLTSTDLELLCQDVLFRKGHRCILLDEQQLDSRGKQLPQLDTETDGTMIDIRAITECGENTIRNSLKSKKKQLRNFNSKTGADCHGVILYFHDSAMFDEAQIVSQLGQTLDTIICVFRNGEIRQYKKS